MNRRNIAASVRARLLNKARAGKLDFNLLLTRYALERILYRLSVSEHRAQFLLKGALLFNLWFDIPTRPTHDADLLGFGSAELPHLENLFRQISQGRVRTASRRSFAPSTGVCGCKPRQSWPQARTDNNGLPGR
jgi:hypothetical protein